jgi:ABC-type sugar transport system ATPase subunit
MPPGGETPPFGPSGENKAMTAPIPLWEFVDVSKAYPGVLANDRVCIKLLAGSIHGLLGENGCGKSTLIKTLSGVQQPDSGQILFNGQPVVISDPQAARQLGIATVFQEFSIVPTLSVGENIFLGNMPRSRFGVIDWKKVHADAAAVLAELEVDIPTEAITGSLSVGEQQLVEIAKAVAMDARMIILDEPTAALGEDARSWRCDPLCLPPSRRGGADRR